MTPFPEASPPTAPLPCDNEMLADWTRELHEFVADVRRRLSGCARMQDTARHSVAPRVSPTDASNVSSAGRIVTADRIADAGQTLAPLAASPISGNADRTLTETTAPNSTTRSTSDAAAEDAVERLRSIKKRLAAQLTFAAEENTADSDTK